MFSDSELIIAAHAKKLQSQVLLNRSIFVAFFFISGRVPLHIERGVGRRQEMIRSERGGTRTDNITRRIRTRTKSQCVN